MNSTTKLLKPEDTLAVDIYGVAQLLSCGISTARKVAAAAEAKIDVPGKRALYSTAKLKTYIESNTH